MRTKNKYTSAVCATKSTRKRLMREAKALAIETNNIFKIGDEVKYDIDYSFMTWYGTVTHVTNYYVDVLSYDGYTTRVHKRFVNFD